MKALEYLLSRPLLATPESIEAAIAIVQRDPEIRTPGPVAVEARKGVPMDGQAGMQRRDGVAVIPIVGPIFRYADWFVDLCGGATVEAVARDLRLALDDPSIRSILLSIDSPGGEAAGIGELAGMVRAANDVKPVVAYTGNQMCSAAYWIGCAAGRVVCAEAAMLGSIGVVMGWQTKADKPGVKSYQFVSSASPNKRPDPETEGGKAVIQQTVDDLAEVFIASVAAYRGVSPDKAKNQFGKGGTLVGRKAVDAGMADAIGTFEGTLTEMAKGPQLRSIGMTASTVLASTNQQQKGSRMFAFLFKPKADGSYEIEPQAASPTTSSTTAPAADASASASASAAAKELAEARRQLALAKVETINVKADGWYDRLFAAHRIVPAEKASAHGAFVQASLDDLLSPLADGKSRVSLIEGIYQSRTPHTLCQEQTASDGDAPENPNLPPGYRTLDSNADPNKPPTQARVNDLVRHLINAGMAGPEALKK